MVELGKNMSSPAEKWIRKQTNMRNICTCRTREDRIKGTWEECVENEEVKGLECPYCMETFTPAGSLNRHINKHAKIAKY